MVRAAGTERVVRTISGHRTRRVFDRYNVSDERDLEQAWWSSSASWWS
jgi:hypothetical protein